MQHLGKIKNPFTDKIERNLSQATMSIDMLDTIRAKTQGKLTQNEKNVLESLIREAKMNYVDEFDKYKKTASTKSSEEKVESKKNQEGKAKASSKEKRKIKNTKKLNRLNNYSINYLEVIFILKFS